MNFLSLSESVEKPCGEVLTYPLQCFQELFLATPAAVATFIMGIGGFAIATIIWGTLFAVTLFALFHVFKFIFRFSKEAVCEFRTMGLSAACTIPNRYLQRLCCKQAPKQEAEPSGNHKMHIDLKWFKSAMKHVSFSKGDNESSPSKDSSLKSPHKAMSRISAFKPKILSPRMLRAKAIDAKKDSDDLMDFENDRGYDGKDNSTSN